MNLLQYFLFFFIWSVVFVLFDKKNFSNYFTCKVQNRNAQSACDVKCNLKHHATPAPNTNQYFSLRETNVKFQTMLAGCNVGSLLAIYKYIAMLSISLSRKLFYRI